MSSSAGQLSRFTGQDTVVTRPHLPDRTALLHVVNLAELIASRKQAGAGTLRDMERRAAERGTPISRSALGDYANGRQTNLPSEETRQAIAAALDVTPNEVTAAALETAAPDIACSSRSLQHAEAWLRLTNGRSEDEVAHLLGVVTAALTAMDAVRGRTTNG